MSRKRRQARELAIIRCALARLRERVEWQAREQADGLAALDYAVAQVEAQVEALTGERSGSL